MNNCRRHIAVLAISLTCQACSFFRRSSEELAPESFTKFPPRFTAIQSVKITWKGEEKTVVASLSREGHDYHVTFLHPTFQTPLLELKTYGPESERTRYFVEKEKLPFNPQLIMDGIVKLYEGSGFKEDGAARRAGTPGVLVYDTETSVYRMRDFGADGACPFPRVIDLDFGGHSPSDARAPLPKVVIETKDVECI